MPSPPYAKLLVSLNGGAAQSGGITAPASATCQLSAESTAGWTSQRWEIWAFPSGFALPAGWSLDAESGVYYSLALSPSAFTLPSAADWGKFLFRLKVNNLDPGNSGVPASQLQDETTGVSVLATSGLEDVAFGETTQFGSRSWAGVLQRDFRILSKDRMEPIPPTLFSPVVCYRISNSGLADSSIPGAVDSGPNGFNMTTSGTARYSHLGPTLAGFLFDGSTNLIHDVSRAELQLTGEMSALWIQVLDTLDTTARLSILSHTATGETEDANALYEVTAVRSGKVWTYEYQHEHSAGTNQTYTINTGPQAGELALFGFNRNAAGKIRFYYNGRPWVTESGALTSPTGGATGRLRIGGGSSSQFVGRLASIAIYPAALTDQQHLDIYNYCMAGVYGYKV